jgi:hypothetical protein
MINIFTRLLNYKTFNLYSTYSFWLSLFIYFFPNALNDNLNDIVRASATMVPILVIYFFYTKPSNDIVDAYAHLFRPEKVTKITIIIIEFVVHLLPLLLVGLPHHGISYIYILLIILTYYFIMHSKIDTIYHKLVTNKEIDDKLLYVILLFLLASQILIN